MGACVSKIYTLSMASWRNVLKSGYGCIDFKSPFIFCNGALHTIAHTNYFFQCILSFDLNDESFREIMVPRRYSWNNSIFLSTSGFQGITGFNYNIWVMEDYGVAESWTKKRIVSKDRVHKFYGYTDKGELLIKNDIGMVSIYPESLNQNVLAVKDADWLAYIANSEESLVLLDDT